MVLSHHAKCQLITTTGSHFFAWVLIRFTAAITGLVLGACGELVEVASEAHLKPSTWLLAWQI